MTLRFERSYGDRLRVRTWRHDGKRIAWPAGAHPGFELGIVHSGKVSYRIGAKTLEAGPGQAVLVPQEVEHATQIDLGTSATSLWIGPQQVVDAAESLGQPALRDPSLLTDGKRIGQLAALVVEEAQRPGRGSELMLAALTDALLLEMHRRTEADRCAVRIRDARILSALSRIERDYATALTVDELAAAAKMSRFHFSRLFQREVGSSPYRYLLRTRLERAAELLRTGRANVTEAALSVGFNDLGRFSQMMQRELGVRPQALRRGPEARAL